MITTTCRLCSCHYCTYYQDFVGLCLTSWRSPVRPGHTLPLGPWLCHEADGCILVGAWAMVANSFGRCPLCFSPLNLKPQIQLPETLTTRFADSGTQILWESDLEVYPPRTFICTPGDFWLSEECDLGSCSAFSKPPCKQRLVDGALRSRLQATTVRMWPAVCLPTCLFSCRIPRHRVPLTYTRHVMHYGSLHL